MDIQPQKKLNATQIAKEFVLRQQSRHLTNEALTEAMDAATLWRGLLAHYQDYARHQNSLTIRPDDVADMMPPGYYAGLKPEQRKAVRNAINKEWDTQQKLMASMLRLIKSQVDAVENATPTFKQTYQERLDQYLNEDLPQAA